MRLKTFYFRFYPQAGSRVMGEGGDGGMSREGKEEEKDMKEIDSYR